MRSRWSGDIRHWVEAASPLGASQLTMQIWGRQGRLMPVSGPEINGCHYYRFDKEALRAWHAEQLTFGEAIEKCIHPRPPAALGHGVPLVMSDQSWFG